MILLLEDKIVNTDWNSIIGNVAVALIGVIGTFAAAIYGGKKSIEAVKLEMKDQKDKQNEEIKEKKANTKKIIKQILKREMEHNYNSLNELGLFKFINNDCSSNLNIATNNIDNYFYFEDYKSIRYEMIKFVDDELVNLVFDIYDSILMIYNKSNSLKGLKKLNKKDYEKLKSLEDNYNKLFNRFNSDR